jgi:hypothetical protein
MVDDRTEVLGVEPFQVCVVDAYTSRGERYVGFGAATPGSIVPARTS